jgi:histidinol-phosphate aminotransferase
VERELGISNSVKLASNENPLGPSPKALAAIRERLEQLHLYPDGDCFYLRRGLAEKLGVAPENLFFGNGSNELIELAVRTFLRTGDEAVMAQQAFIVYPLVVQAAGGIGRAVPLREFTHDLGAILKAITPRTRLVLLANPNNPTGTIFHRDEWEWFLKQVPEETLILVDEAYFEYVQDSEYPDSLRYHSDHKMLFTVRTFSKLYGLAGLRVGYGVGSSELIELMQRVRQPFNVNAAAQWAALAAIGDTEHVRRTLEVNREGMEYLTRELTALGVQYVPSHANFLLLRVGDGNAIFQRLLIEGIIVRPMAVYGLPQYIRVTIGTMTENERFIESLKKVLAVL